MYLWVINLNALRAGRYDRIVSYFDKISTNRVKFSSDHLNVLSIVEYFDGGTIKVISVNKEVWSIDKFVEEYPLRKD